MTEKEKTATPKTEKKKSNTVLFIIIAVMSAICFPYVYYALQVKNYILTTGTPE